jgi:hypothetical protein
MTRRYAFCITLTLGVSIGALTGITHAQTLYKSGQGIQPVFEGWERNADGSFSLLFGYLNRNYVEAPEIPLGPNNSFGPAPADRGQPTHFYPRRQSFVFRVILPADWGQKELVWTLTHNGRTATARASLSREWEIDEGVWKGQRQWLTGGGMSGRKDPAEVTGNRPPSINIMGSTTQTVAVSHPMTLTASVSDDGKPGPLARRRGSSADEVAPDPPAGIGGGGPRSGTQRISPASQDMVKEIDAAATGLAVTWLHYRGPGQITFEPRVIPIKKSSGEQAVVTARFSEPGTYVVRAVADDRIYTTPVDVTVIVKQEGDTSQK